MNAFVRTTRISYLRVLVVSPLLVLFFVLAVHAQQRTAFSYALKTKELTHTATSVTLEITVPDPRFDTLTGVSVLRRLPGSVGGGDPLAPISLPIRASKNAQVSVISSEPTLSKVPQNFALQLAALDQPLDGSTKKYYQSPTSKSYAHQGVGFLSLRYVGRARAVDLSTLSIGCYDFDRQTNTLRHLRKIVVRISDPNGITLGVQITDIQEAYRASASTFRDRTEAQIRAQLSAQPSNKKLSPQGAGDVQQTPGLRADDGNLYRMYVNQTGIYHITFDDAKNFGFDPSNIDPTTLRIISGGQQVPVYVFTQQNGRFEEGDYFEFFGQEKLLNYNSKFGDEYYDPFTHNNVYYLVWGTKFSAIPQGGVKRMVEESGEIREADKSKYTDLANSSFRSRLHYERNNLFDNLDITDVNDLTSLRDHYFIGRIFTAQTMSIDTVTPYPDLENGKPYTLRVAFQGLSHFDPGTVGTHGEPLDTVSNEQQPDVSINGKHVLFGIWDSQVLRILSTDTASQRLSPTLPDPNDLSNGVTSKSTSVRVAFPLNVSIESKVKTSQQFCSLAVNWFDLDYDRLYSAYQNQVQFSIPKGSPSGLYQFTISNFTRSDISIYRLGVSKIANIFIDGSAPNQNGIKTIFQINVASDADQFFATVDSLKLKPMKYLRDSWQDLRNVANQGAYLIITSRDHLNKFSSNPPALKALLDERQTREHLSGQIIDVANIYDQFSFGCRSPQAIKDFLSYAYNYWQDPPKYVLFVGTTHPGTDDTLAGSPPEQVPTFYFQSYDFGATLTDTWYSTLDGEDLIPDILVGRLPSTNQNDDVAYVAKVLAYDRDYVTPALWKDRSLFVSGQKTTGVGIAIDFFGEITNLLQSSVPENNGIDRLSLDEGAYYGTDQNLVDDINGGISYLHFMGHGGLGVWADVIAGTGRSLFLASDVTRLTNHAHCPFVSSLTCFTGAFDGSTKNALLPALLLYPNGGAIGALGTSSFGFRDQDVRLAESLLPRMFDTLPASYSERVTNGKIGFYLANDPIGNLLDPTLTLSYNYLGDPVVEPFETGDVVGVTLSTRNPQPGQSVTLNGTTSILSGSARIELMDSGNSPLSPADVQTVTVKGGVFTATDQIPSTLKDGAGSYHITVYGATTTQFARISEDVSFSSSRVSQLAFNPHPVGPNTTLDLSAAVQSPSGVSGVFGVTHVYAQSSTGVLQLVRSDSLPMSTTSDPGVYHRQIAGSGLANSMVVSAYIWLYPTTGQPVMSDSIEITIGSSADPSAYHDALHLTLIGRFRTLPSGLVWQENVYNWGSTDAPGNNISLIDERTKQIVAFQNTVDIPAHGVVQVSLPITETNLDTAQFVLAVQPQSGSTPLNLRDSVQTNDSTADLAVPRGAASYISNAGTNADFDSNYVAIQLLPGAEGSIASDVIRVTRIPTRPVLQQYSNQQPDIHFASLYSPAGQRYDAVRIVSDSLGAIPLTGTTPCTVTLAINPNDSVIAANKSRLFYIYRQDDKSKQWTILSTTRNANGTLSAKSQNLGNFAVAYNTDVILPTVDLTVEGQVFVSGGDVPAQPHLTAVMQDADGIDITPGKTIVKVDGRTLGSTEFAMLDSLRTPTTANLHFEPSLANGLHTISVQSTDNDGNLSTIQTLQVNVSNNFVVRTLGSYPNPFSVQMFLAYQIQGIPFAQSVKLKIYTVSGRLIRTLLYPSGDPNQTFGFLKGGTGVPTSLGYHEVWWDGRDDGGSDVANGVYFYKLFVTTATDERDITGKLARIR